MKQFTVEEFREALCALPSLKGCSKDAVVNMFLKEKITKTKLDGWHPYAYLRETFLSDAMVNLLGVSKEEFNIWVWLNNEAVQKLFNTRLGWTSEEWAIELLNFVAARRPEAVQH